jgi:hypothetical protein
VALSPLILLRYLRVLCVRRLRTWRQRLVGASQPWGVSTATNSFRGWLVVARNHARDVNRRAARETLSPIRPSTKYRAPDAAEGRSGRSGTGATLRLVASLPPTSQLVARGVVGRWADVAPVGRSPARRVAVHLVAPWPRTYATGHRSTL